MANTKSAVNESTQEAPEGVAAIQLTGDEQRGRQSTIDRMRDLFAAQPKRKVRLAEDTRVQINGYPFFIKGKTTVEVPESVALVLEEAGLY